MRSILSLLLPITASSFGAFSLPSRDLSMSMMAYNFPDCNVIEEEGGAVLPHQEENNSEGISRRYVFAGVAKSILCASAIIFGFSITDKAVAGGEPYEADRSSDYASESADNSNQQQNEGTPECDEECKEKRRQRVEEMRAMRRQSRSSTSRQEVFELSKQRAKLYGSEYEGANCVEGIPCL